jgi:hypothetical protein
MKRGSAEWIRRSPSVIPISEPGDSLKLPRSDAIREEFAG